MNTTTKTAHSPDCNHSFGRRTAGCLRCDELLAGAKPRAWGGAEKAKREASLRLAIRSHVCGAACGPVCTAFDW